MEAMFISENLLALNLGSMIMQLELCLAPVSVARVTVQKGRSLRVGHFPGHSTLGPTALPLLLADRTEQGITQSFLLNEKGSLHDLKTKKLFNFSVLN